MRGFVPYIWVFLSVFAFGDCAAAAGRPAGVNGDVRAMAEQLDSLGSVRMKRREYEKAAAVFSEAVAAASVVGDDGLLTMIKLNLVQLRKSLSVSDVRLDRSIELTDSTITEMRRMVRNMMPETVGRFGLATALGEFCKGCDSIRFHFFGTDRRLGEEIEINMYRIACELVNNALKHSGATAVDVQLIIGDDRVFLAVEDNGRGLSSGPGAERIGAVRSRAGFIGAKVDVYSRPGSGTEISVELAIRDYDKSDDCR